MSPRKILIIDQHPVVCLGLRSIIERSGQFDCCGEAHLPDAALQRLSALDPDLAIAGLLPGRQGGLQLVQMIAQISPRARILVFSGRDETTYARRALAIGASGYLMKCNQPDLILQALHRILAGSIYLSERMSNIMLESLQQSPSTPIPALASVSNRELQVLQLIGEGNTTGQIAESLGISPKTIGTHRENLKNKLAAKSGVDLITKAIALTQTGAI